MKGKVYQHKNKNRNSITNELNLFYLLPISIVLAIVPIIVRLKVIQLEGDIVNYWTDNVNYDFFSYYKAQWLIISAIVAVSILGYLLYHNRIKIKKTKIYIPMVMYSISVVLSALLSEYTNVALWGFPDRYEGMFVHLSYMILLFVTINIVNSEKQINFLLCSLLVGTSVTSIIGSFQFIGLDIFNSSVGKSFILPGEFTYLAPHISFPYSKSLLTYGTLFHPNYAGGYMAIILPIVAVSLLLTNQFKYKAMLILLNLLVIINLLGSRARGGMVAFIVTLLLFIVLLRKKVLMKKKVLIYFSTIFIILLLIMNNFTDGRILEKLTTINIDPRVSANSAGLQDIIMEDEKLIVKVDGVTLTIDASNETLRFYDTENNQVEYIEDNGEIFLQSDHYQGLNLVHDSTDIGKVVFLRYKNINETFLLVDNEFKFLDYHGQLVDFEPVDKWGFEGREKLGSARGYIWSRSIPLLKDTVIVGKGPDTFALVFPQHDYVGKLVAYGDTAIIVDKPHNIFIQIAINSGVLSLIALLSIFFMYLIPSFRIIYNGTFENKVSLVNAGVFLAVVAYIVTGFFNDSVVFISPVLFVLMGIGISINIQLYNEEL